MSLSSSPSSVDQLRSAAAPSATKPRLILKASPRKAAETDRKFTSDFFGRNKSETSAIPDGVWAFVARKEYQRSKYASEKSADAYRTFWLSALKTQLVRLRLWRPEATYEVKLLSRAVERLKTYNSELLKNGNNIAAAERLVHVDQITGKKGPVPVSNANAIHPSAAQYIQTYFAGMCSIDYVLNTIYPWIERSLHSGTLTRMPPIEFLIQPPVANDTINEPSKNHQMWCDYKKPKWTKADHQAAITLMSLSAKIYQPMILTWEAYNAAKAADAAKRAALTKTTSIQTAASQSTSSAHTTDSESALSIPVTDSGSDQKLPTPTYEGKGKGRMVENDAESNYIDRSYNERSTASKKQKTVAPTDKGSGKRRMVDEDEEPNDTDLVYNGRRTANKRLKITRAPPRAPVSGQKPRQYTSMTMMKGRQVCEVRGQDD